MRRNLPERRKILVVEDYSDARDMYVDLLRFEGFDVVIAVNGQEAVDTARSENPDVILMDLSLPLLDGCEATRMLKADGRTKDIPVLAITGHVLGPMQQSATDSGAVDVLGKPCLPADLVARIRSLLAARESTG